MPNQPFFSRNLPFLAGAASLACLVVFTYARSFGEPGLFNSDTLFPERLFRDIVLEGGSLNLWTFPMPAYWLDLGVYFLARAATGEVNAAMAAYGAVQLALLALALLYCVWPAAVSAKEKAAAPVFSALAVLLLSLCGEYNFLVLRMPAMHGMTIAMAVLCMGIVLRLSETPGSFPYRVLFTVAVFGGIASDGIFLLWFIIPAAAFFVFLFWRKEISRRDAAFCICCIIAACVLGALWNHAFKPPTVDHSAVHISLSKPFRAVPAMARNLATVLGDEPIATALLALTVLVVAFRRKALPRRFITLTVILVACTVSGVLANGHAQVSYILPVVLVLPLFGLALLPMCLPGSMIPLLGGAGLAALLLAAGDQARRERSPVQPPLAACIDAMAKRHPIRNGAGTFWESNYAPLFTETKIPFSVSHLGHLTHHPFLATSRHEKDRYDLIMLNSRAASFPDMETMLFYLNGKPTEDVICPGTGARLYAYPGTGARLATEWDYITDDGKLASTRLDRDAVVWRGNAAIAPEMTLTGVELRYRMNRIWLMLYFTEPVARLAGKTITVYAAGNRAKPAARLAGKHLSKTGDKPMDALWRRLAWRETIVVGQGTAASYGENGTVVYLEGPSRETKDLPMLLLETEGKRTRVR